MTRSPRAWPIEELARGGSGVGQRFPKAELYGIGDLAGRILEDVQVWLNIHDQDLNLVVWNRVAERISGYEASEVLGHSQVWDWLYPDREYREAIQLKAKAIVEEGETAVDFENEILCKNGETRCMSWNSRALIDEAGRLCGAITVGHDVTERQRAEADLRRAHDELSVLYDVASFASQPLGLDAILEKCLVRVTAALGCDGGLLHLVEGSDADLYLAAHSGIPDGLLEALDRALPGRGVIGSVYAGNRRLLVDDLRADEHIAVVVRGSGFRSYAGVSLRAKGRVIGVLSVLSEKPGWFSERDLELLDSIGDQVRLAIESARLHEQAERIAVIEERGRLARELHDSASQSMYSLTLFAEACRRHQLAGEQTQSLEYLERIGQTAEAALKEMRLLVYELRPVELDRDGLLGALQNRLQAVERRAGVKVELHAAATPELSTEAEDAVYRASQEALNNALKHSAAKSVRVTFDQSDDRFTLLVEDDGVGFDTVAASAAGGLGLVSIRERIEGLGGSAQVDSQPGSGTRVRIEVPLERTAP